MKSKRVNRTDLTLRNLRALKKRVQSLELKLTAMETLHFSNPNNSIGKTLGEFFQKKGVASRRAS